MLSGILNTVLFGASFILVLSALVFFHELGHFSVARMFKVAVDRFSIGFGKPIAKWKAKSGMEWSIGSIPLGGYVKFTGDAGAASNPDNEKLAEIKSNLEKSGGVAVEDCFHFKPLWQKVLIVLAGPLANFLLAILIFAGLALAYGTYERKSVVLEVSPGSAAEAAGVQAGDQFLTLDGKDVSLVSDLQVYVAIRSDQKLEAVVDRGGSSVSFPITPQRKLREDFIGGKNAIGTIGVTLDPAQENYKKITFNPFTALGYGTAQVGKTIASTGTYVGRIFKGREDGKALGGVVRIAAITGKTAVDAAAVDLPWGKKLENLIVSLLSIGAVLSIGLGVANLMPIPVLDGGHLLFYGYEAVAGRPLSERKQEFGFRIGFAVLLTLFVILTWNDIGYVRSFFS